MATKRSPGRTRRESDWTPVTVTVSASGATVPWQASAPDFAPIYARLATQETIPAGDVREGDLVHQRGSGEGWASDGDV